MLLKKACCVSKSNCNRSIIAWLSPTRWWGFVRIGDVDSDLDFFSTKVIWSKGNREAQLRNVVTAAFGPISILLGKPADDSAPGDS